MKVAYPGSGADRAASSPPSNSKKKLQDLFFYYSILQNVIVTIVSQYKELSNNTGNINNYSANLLETFVFLTLFLAKKSENTEKLGKVFCTK